MRIRFFDESLNCTEIVKLVHEYLRNPGVQEVLVWNGGASTNWLRRSGEIYKLFQLLAVERPILADLPPPRSPDRPDGVTS